MKHWISGVPCYLSVGGHSAGPHHGEWYLFHFLRLLGWDLVAECDTTNDTCNHIPDGAMEALNVTSWSAVGTATRSKSVLQLHDGYQSLTFTTAASGDGIQSASFLSMDASQLYSFSMWCWNNSGHSLNAYIDTGNGSWVLLGAVADNSGVWTRHRWTWTSHTTVTACRFKLVDEAGTVSAGQVYVDSIYTTRSWFEQKVRGQGTDGVVETGNNKFSSGSYAFSVADLTAKRVVCFVDLVNEGNSGVYEIDSLDGTKAVLRLQDDLTSFLVAATGLSFRVLDKADIPNTWVGSAGAAGFCLESPHATKWRWKCRFCWYRTGSGGDYYVGGSYTSAPESCELNVDNFRFHFKQRSTTKILFPESETNWTADQLHVSQNHRGLGSLGAYTRFYAVTDGETYFLGLHNMLDGGAGSAFFMGFLGDNYLPFEDTYTHIQQGPNYIPASGLNPTNRHNSLIFTLSQDSWCAFCATFAPNGLASLSCLASAGYGTAALVTETMTNAKPNPWSGKESIRPFMLFTDWDGVLGRFGVIESTNQDFGHCRANLAKWTPFGASREWLHAANGVCIAWHGRPVAP